MVNWTKVVQASFGNEGSMLLWMIVAFIFILGPLMFLHEFGHFWAAKKSGVSVEEFGFGLGPKLKTLFVRDGTEYTIRAIPFAAFVRLHGEETNLADGIMNASRKTKFITFAAGPAMNIAVTVLLLWIAYLFGPPAFTQVALQAVDAESPAGIAGLQPRDIILMADELEIRDGIDLKDYTNSHLGDSISLLVERDGKEVKVELTPRTEGEFDPTIEGPMGVTMYYLDGPPAPQNVIEALGSAGNDFIDVIDSTLHWPGQLANALWSKATQGEPEPGTKPPEQDLRYLRPVGIVGILQLIAITLKTGIMEGYWFYIFRTAGLISMALGVTNLLPIPALDGGRLLFIGIDWASEKLFRKKINPEKEIIIHAVGLMVLLLLMFFITWQDIVNPLIQFPTPTP